jgi:hypothetical protein
MNTKRPITLYPPADGRGKWHAAPPVGDHAGCGCGARLDKRTGHRIQLDANADIRTAHPICCTRCLKGATK